MGPQTPLLSQRGPFSRTSSIFPGPELTIRLLWGSNDLEHNHLCPWCYLHAMVSGQVFTIACPDNGYIFLHISCFLIDFFKCTSLPETPVDVWILESDPGMPLLIILPWLPHCPQDHVKSSNGGQQGLTCFSRLLSHWSHP